MVDVSADFGPDRGARNVCVSPGRTVGARKTGVPWTRMFIMYLTIIA